MSPGIRDQHGCLSRKLFGQLGLLFAMACMLTCATTEESQRPSPGAPSSPPLARAQFIPLASAPAMPRVSPREVSILVFNPEGASAGDYTHRIEKGHWTKFPAGVREVNLNSHRLPPEQRIVLEPDYPTAEDPHRILGTVVAPNCQYEILRNLSEDQIRRWRERDPYLNCEDEAILAILNEAALHGANAIALVGQHPDFNFCNQTAVALRLSTAQPHLNFSTAEELLSPWPDTVPKTAKRELPWVQKLEAYHGVKLHADRGTCYALAIALDKDARLSSEAQATMTLWLKDSNGFDTQIPLCPCQTLSPRVFVKELGCQVAPVWINAFLQDVHKNEIALGTGLIHFQPYSWQLSAEAFKALQVKECNSCRRTRDRCLDRAEMRCISEFKDCLKRAELTDSDCH